MKLTLENITVAFGKKMVLHEISTVFSPQKITAVIGQSGCGKTTLLRTINRTVEEEGGSISGKLELAAADVLKMPTETLRKQIGMVFQQPIAFPFSIEKNLSYVLNYHFKLSKAERKARITQYLTATNLFDEVNSDLTVSANQLSGGQKQRLAIARALCAEPDFLLLDEPCSALDMENTLAIEQLLLQIKQAYGIVIVTHNLAQAKRIADDIVLMDSGRIIEHTGKKQFFSRPATELGRKFIQYM